MSEMEKTVKLLKNAMKFDGGAKVFLQPFCTHLAHQLLEELAKEGHGSAIHTISADGWGHDVKLSHIQRSSGWCHGFPEAALEIYEITAKLAGATRKEE